MSVWGGLRSQLNNVRYFSELFPPRVLARNLWSLPLDYARPDGFAGPPMVVNLLTTSRCGLNCSMCSAREFRRQRFDEMSAADLERIVRQTLPFTPSYYFGGGEPFLRQDLEELIAVVKGHGLRLGVVTNGMHLSPARGERVKALGLDQILFSLHGTREVHDGITGIKGAFERAAENIAAFCRGPRRTRVMLNFVMSRDNVSHVRDLVAFGRTLGVDRVRVEHLLYMTYDDVRLHDDWCQVHVLDEAIRKGLGVTTYICHTAPVDGFAEDLPPLLDEVKREFGDFVFVKPDLDPNEIAHWYRPGYRSHRRCIFVWRSLFIDPEGNVIPCQHYAGMRLGNALREPLMQIWNSPRYRRLRRLTRHGLPPACSRCCKL